MQWIEVSVPTRSDEIDDICAQLAELGAGGMAVEDEAELDLWTSSVWAQVGVYALADKAWHKSFRPAGVADAEWAARVRDHICGTIFTSLRYNDKKEVGV